MEEMSKHGRIGRAAMKAGMDRKTARGYLAEGKLPSQIPPTLRSWRTRGDPFAEDWPDLEAMLEAAPELEAKTLFDDLVERKPGRYQEGQLRTLQRRVKVWLAQHGPDKVVFFAQEHRPGEAMQTDFTWGTELQVTIAGEPFVHLLCHVVLPYSNWEWATVCQSESLAAIRHGVQEALFRLGRHPTWHQTDNTTAATHDLRTGKRGFNKQYAQMMKHFGMEPRTIAVGESNQNGDVEALNNALKRRLNQHLLLRGSRDFDSVGEYERWLWGVIEKANRQRSKRLAEEQAVMTPLAVSRLPDYTEERVRVSSGSTIRIKHNTYSVPSRLRDEHVVVRLYEDRLEVYYSGQLQMTVERLVGRFGHRINYRHLIWSLVRKPTAFARYRYREDLFPTLTFRRAYDALGRLCGTTRKTDMEYLRLLLLAASTMESEVETGVQLLLEEGTAPTSERVKALVTPGSPEVPALAIPAVDLTAYDALLVAREAVAP
jgi:transposase InsO family protein